MTGKQDDYGYFGKGIDGYVHYKQAFDRNFSQTGRVPHSSTPHNATSTGNHSEQHNTQPNMTELPSEKDAPNLLDNSMMYSDSFYYPPAQQHSQYNPPSKGESDKNHSRSAFCTTILFILMWMGALWALVGIPYLILALLTGSMSAAESGVGILILLVGGALILFR